MPENVEPRTFAALAHHAELVQNDAANGFKSLQAAGALDEPASIGGVLGASLALIERLAAQVVDLADRLAEMHEE